VARLEGVCAAQRFQEQPEGRQTLTQIVVQVARDPSPFFLLRNHQPPQQPHTRRLGLRTVGNLRREQRSGFRQLPAHLGELSRLPLGCHADAYGGGHRGGYLVGDDRVATQAERVPQDQHRRPGVYRDSILVQEPTRFRDEAAALGIGQVFSPDARPMIRRAEHG